MLLLCWYTRTCSIVSLGVAWWCVRRLIFVESIFLVHGGGCGVTNHPTLTCLPADVLCCVLVLLLLLLFGWEFSFGCCFWGRPVGALGGVDDTHGDRSACRQVRRARPGG